MGSADVLAGSFGVVEIVPPKAEAVRRSTGPWNRDEVGESVQIIAPDRVSAAVLVDLVGSSYPLELVGTETSWVIRLRPVGAGWERELLRFVERWLESCPLPCATIVCGGRRYIIRSASTHRDLGVGVGQVARLTRC